MPESVSSMSTEAIGGAEVVEVAHGQERAEADAWGGSARARDGVADGDLAPGALRGDRAGDLGAVVEAVDPAATGAGVLLEAEEAAPAVGM
jgi:hypothetical protein